MRKHIIIFLSVATLLSTSCEKAEFLNRKPYSTSTPENFYYNSEDNFKMALTGCYEMINASKMGENGTSVTYGTFYQGLQWILGGPSDEILSGKTAVPYTMASCLFTESDNALVSLWNAFYHGIYRCNELLSKIEVLQSSNKTKYEAEARFLRGYYYNILALVFGGVPIVEYPSSGKEARSSLESVYKYILEDYGYAYENLDAKGLIHPLSANKYTVAAYIARACNYLAACKRFKAGADLAEKQPLNSFDWVDESAMSKKALDMCKDVIDNSPYILVDEYHMLFRETTKSTQYKECLFCADLPVSSTEGAWPASARMAAPTGSYVASEVYGGVLNPNPFIFYLYDKRDPRRDHNFTDSNATVSDKTGKVVTITIDGINYSKCVFNRSTNSTYKLLYDSDTQSFNPCVSNLFSAGKYRLVARSSLQHTNSQHCLSYPLMRLADVYLMAGEAEYFVSGNVTEARKYFRPVVLRAANKNEALCDSLMTAYEKSNFVEEILDHRERELVFEFSRKTDLIRFNKLDEAIAALRTDTVVPQRIQDLYPGKTFKPHSNISGAITTMKANYAHYKMWAPISYAQIAANPNLTQNPGWE